MNDYRERVRSDRTENSEAQTKFWVLTKTVEQMFAPFLIKSFITFSTHTHTRGASFEPIVFTENPKQVSK